MSGGLEVEWYKGLGMTFNCLAMRFAGDFLSRTCKGCVSRCMRQLLVMRGLLAFGVLEHYLENAIELMLGVHILERDIRRLTLRFVLRTPRQSGRSSAILTFVSCSLCSYITTLI